MKMTKLHFNELQGLVNIELAETPDLKARYKGLGLSKRRFAWDLLWSTGYAVHVLYDYLNDTHIETALYRIIGEY